MSEHTIGRITFATPGPWKVSSLDKRTIGPVRLLHAEGTDVPQLQAVAVVKERTGETEANARLIAAAPDLLAALKAIVGHYMSAFGGNSYELAIAAIAKAEGRDQ